MALTSLLEPVLLLGAFITAIVSFVIYQVYLHPISHIRGPLIAKVTPLWLYRLAYVGTEASTIDRLHRRYGPVVRIAPNEVDISDGAALAPVYTKNGGFLKHSCYTNFDIDGHHTIFSALSPAHRAVRSKAVVSMFAPATIRENKDVIRGCVVRMVDKINMEKAEAKGRPINLLNITRSLALDAVTAYLFHRPYNGIMEKELSASQFVDTFVAVGKLFYLPSWLFQLMEQWEMRSSKEGFDEVSISMAKVEQFAVNVVDETRVEDATDGQTYQARLLKAGISREETIAQCKDLMFAGTDSTGMNLATICWFLARQPETYEKLRQEVLDAPPDNDPQTLPYLSGTIKEGLRLSMANPTRLPRIVGPGGLAIPSLPFIPEGTSVGLSAFSLHLNDAVFEKAHAFIPERWSKPSEDMLRDSVPWGVGPRQCIARNLATAELYWAVQELVRQDVLRGAKSVKDKIEILEWFNSKVVDEKIELVWS